MVTREIVTLQLGEYANFVGTHLWNLQESSFCYSPSEIIPELDPDVMFREGRTLHGKTTFTPRLVLVDVKESLASLPIHGRLYSDGSHDGGKDSLSWNETMTVHKQMTNKTNEFLDDLSLQDMDEVVHDTSSSSYNLDKVVKTWSDFKRIHYHPRSTILTAGRANFDQNHSSPPLHDNVDAIDQIEETVRFFAEECDMMQGFHVVCDVNNSFAALATSVVEYLNDEFNSKTCFTFPVLSTSKQTGTANKVKLERLTNILTMSGMLQHSNLVTPMSLCADSFNKCGKTRQFPNLIYDSSLDYHTSAILGCGLEAFSRSYRLRPLQQTMLDIAQTLTLGSRNLTAFNLSLPLPCTQDHRFTFDLLRHFTNELPWQPLTPNVTSGIGDTAHCFSQCMTLCGIPQMNTTPDRDQHKPVRDRSSPSDRLKLYVQERMNPDDLTLSITDEPIKAKDPFPHIFSHNLQEGQSISTKSGNSGAKSPYLSNAQACHEVPGVAVLSTIESSTALSPLLKQYSACTSSLKRWTSQYCHSDVSTGLSEALEHFQTLEHDYYVITDDDSSD